MQNAITERIGNYLNPYLPSVVRPVPHSAQITVPVPLESLDDPSDDSDLNAEEQNKDQEFRCEKDNLLSFSFSQN